MIRNATGYRSTSVMDICEQIITSSMFLFLSPRIFSNCSRAIIQRSHTFCLFFLLLQHLFCCCSFYSFYFTVSSASRTDHFIWYVFESVCSVYFVCVEHKIYILLFGLIWTQTSSSWKWNETETTTEKKTIKFLRVYFVSLKFICVLFSSCDSFVELICSPNALRVHSVVKTFVNECLLQNDSIGVFTTLNCLNVLCISIELNHQHTAQKIQLCIKRIWIFELGNFFFLVLDWI